jgi:hypothetical protein
MSDFDWTSMKSWGTLLTPSASTQKAFADAGPALQVGGMISSALGSYYSAQQAQYQLESTKLSYQYQQQVAEINAVAMEREAQSILMSGQYQNAASTMKYGKIKSSTKASQAARGITLGIGSAAEEIATIDLMKETDSITINGNAVRAAAAARIKGAGLTATANMLGVSASAAHVASELINPFSAGANSLISGGSQIAQSWYKDRRLAAIEARLGLGQ